MPRVLHVLEATIGGTKRHLLDLLPGLMSHGWDVEVACPRVRDEHHGDMTFWDDISRLGIKAHEVPMSRRPLRTVNALALGKHAALIRGGNYDVVHAQSSIAGALARPAVLLSGRRPALVYSPHGFAFLSEEWRGRRRFFLSLERVLSRLTDRIIAVSPTEREQALEHRIALDSKIAVVPNGVVSADMPSSRLRIGDIDSALRDWDGHPLVGTIARMLAQKDPLTWIRVAARVAAIRPDVRFLWIWGGDLEAQTRAEAGRLGLEGKIRFLGHRSDARQILAALDVFLLTSLFEGLPYSPIEALACGTPVVATDVAGTRDVVRHDITGLLAPPGDVASIATHVLALLEAPERARQLGAAGRADVLNRFSIEQMVRGTAAVYDSLIRVSSVHVSQPAR